MIADFVSLLLLLYSPELFFIVWLEMDPYKPESRQRKDRDDDKSKSGQDYAVNNGNGNSNEMVCEHFMKLKTPYYQPFWLFIYYLHKEKGSGFMKFWANL